MERIDDLLRVWRRREGRPATIDDIVERWGEDVLAPEQPEDEHYVRLANGLILSWLDGQVLTEEDLAERLRRTPA